MLEANARAQANLPRFHLFEAQLIFGARDQLLQLLMQCLSRYLRIATVCMHMQRTFGDRIVQHQHTGHNVVNLNGARYRILCDEMFRRALQIVFRHTE